MRRIAIIGNDPLADRLSELLRQGQRAEAVRMEPTAPLEDCAAVIVTDATVLSLPQMQDLLKLGRPVLGHVFSVMELEVLRQWCRILQESGGSFRFAWPLRFSPAVQNLRGLLRGQTVLAVRSLSGGTDPALRVSGSGHELTQETLTVRAQSVPPDPEQSKLKNQQLKKCPLPHALDLIRFFIGDLIHVSAIGTTKGLGDPLAAGPAALVANLHAADRTLAQHVQVQSEKCCGELEVLTTTARYRLDWQAGALTIQDAAGEKTETFPADGWPAVLHTFLDRFEPDSVSPASGFTEPGSRVQKITGGTPVLQQKIRPPTNSASCCPPTDLPDFADSFSSLATAWAVVSSLTSGQLSAVPLR